MKTVLKKFKKPLAKAKFAFVKGFCIYRAREMNE